MTTSARQQRVPFRTVALWALTVVAVAALSLLAWQLADVVLLAFAGVLMAIFFHGLAEWIARFTGLSNHWSLAIVLVGLAAIAVAGFLLCGNAVANQLAQLAEELPRSLDKLRAQLEQSEWGNWMMEQSPDSTEQLPVSPEDMTTYASSAAASVGNVLAALLIVLFLAVYLAFDPQTYAAGTVRLFPVGKRKRIAEVFAEVNETLKWWLIGKFLSMFVVAMMTYVGLLMIGVPLALTLSLIAGLSTFVPNFGPILSAIPAVLLGFVDSPMTAMYVVILYVAIQTVESYLITPLIQQETISLPPALTISAQVAMGVLLGAGGVILATPLTATALVLVRRFYVDDTLERSVR